MARLTNGTNQSLESGSALAFSSATQLTISTWLYWDAFSNDNMVALESSSNYNSGADGAVRFIMIPNDSVSAKFAVNVKGVGYNKSEFTRPSAGVYHHYMMLFDLNVANEVPNVYVDAVDQTLTHSASTDNTGPFSDQVLYAMSRGNASLFAAGRIAEIAIWTGINLSAANATSLFGGALPSTIAAGNLAYYWKLCGQTSPEPPAVGGIDMTVNGATFVGHPSEVSGSCFTPITGLRPSMRVPNVLVF